SGLRALAHRLGVLALLPPRLAAMESLLPELTLGGRGTRLPPRVPAQGKSRRRVGLLLGCVQRVFFAEVNAATARVLAAEGCEVIVPPGQECCGAPLRVAYHDACHLQHAQNVRLQPRRLLSAIPQVELVEISDAALCCGSAGIFNLIEPRAAADLGDRKVRACLATDPDVIVSGNP